MTPTDCSALRVYAPLRSALNVRPLDAQRPTILPLYSYSMGPLVSPAGSVVAKRVPLARSNPLHTNIGACKESIAPLASKLAVEHGFLHWSHELASCCSRINRKATRGEGQTVNSNKRG